MHRGILTLPMLGLQLRCACSPAPPGFLEMCIEKLLLFLISEFPSCPAPACPASPALLLPFDTPCGLNGFPKLQLQHSHHFLLAAGAGNPPLPSSSHSTGIMFFSCTCHLFHPGVCCKRNGGSRCLWVGRLLL